MEDKIYDILTDLLSDEISKQEAIEVIDNTSFDLLLLDINLGDGTGFEVLEAVKNKSFNVIFTTAYDEYAVKAFKYCTGLDHFCYCSVVVMSSSIPFMHCN